MADSKRCVWERLQMVEAEPFGEEISVTMMLIAWVRVYGHRSVSVYRCRIENQKKKKKRESERRPAANSTGSRKASPRCICTWDMIYEIYMQVFVRGSLLCVYWSVIVYANRCWLGEMQPLLCLRVNPLRAALFSSSNLPPAENVIAVTVTCHFLFISTHDRASTLSILLLTWVFFFFLQQISSAIER